MLIFKKIKVEMLNIFLETFGNYGRPFCKNLASVIPAMMRCCSCNTAQIAAEMNNETDRDFKTNDIKLFRFLKDAKFQIDDMLWRRYGKLLFGLLKERKKLKDGDIVYINVDFTSMEDYFLILSASVNLSGRNIPLYFTTRNYPKRKGQFNQKNMEKAFIKGLRHVLSKKYNYVIVADRGFGNERFTSLCEKNNFDYIIRINSNINVNYKHEKINLKTLEKQDRDLDFINIIPWKKSARIVVRTKGEAIWYLATNISNETSKKAKEKQKTQTEIGNIYADRFKIEKCFQDQKSSGFNIEKTKIRKYDRFKRLLFCTSLSQLLLTFLGEFLHNNNHPIKKNFPSHTDLISACFKSQKELYDACIKSQ